MEKPPEERIEAQRQQSVLPSEQPQQISQRNWWRIGFLVTLALFLTTAGGFGFYVFKELILSHLQGGPGSHLERVGSDLPQELYYIP